MRKFLILIALLASVSGFAQVDKQDVRRGNRQFAREKYGDADISYRKALNADSTSVRAAYDLGNNLYRQGDYQNAGKYYGQALRHVSEVKNVKKQSELAFDTYFNTGDAALQQKQYRAAMEAFVQALLIDPDNMEAKENYVYARKMLENNPDGGGNNDQNQDQNQDQDQDQNQNQDQQNQDQNQDQKDQDKQDQQQKPYNGSEISPQQAQQMLQAIQAKEKETQDKVNKEKAAVLKSRQKEKNW